MALEGVEGAWMGMPCARIRDLIWPMQESAKDSKRLALSTRSAYSTISKSAWESFGWPLWTQWPAFHEVVLRW